MAGGVGGMWEGMKEEGKKEKRARELLVQIHAARLLLHRRSVLYQHQVEREDPRGDGEKELHPAGR